MRSRSWAVTSPCSRQNIRSAWPGTLTSWRSGKPAPGLAETSCRPRSPGSAGTMLLASEPAGLRWRGPAVVCAGTPAAVRATGYGSLSSGARSRGTAHRAATSPSCRCPIDSSTSATSVTGRWLLSVGDGLVHERCGRGAGPGRHAHTGGRAEGRRAATSTRPATPGPAASTAPASSVDRTLRRPAPGPVRLGQHHPAVVADSRMLSQNDSADGNGVWLVDISG